MWRLTSFKRCPQAANSSSEARENDSLRIEVEDTGGIDETVKTKVFDPLFTTKDKGLGLGLSVVYKIINQHDGRIQIFDTADGTRFSLIFPTS